jgi:hypothetical protein
MKTTRLFHTIVMVGVTLTAPAVVATPALVMSGCTMQPLDSFPTIHTPDFAGFPTIQNPDLASWVVIDASWPTIAEDLAHLVGD